MKHCLMILGVLFSSYSTSNAQKLLEADEYFKKGNDYHYQGEYDSALLFFDKALYIYYDKKRWKKYVMCINNKSIDLWKLGKYNNALREAHLALESSNKKLGVNDLEAAMAYNSIGIINRLQGNYELALEFFRKSLNIRMIKDDSILISTSYNNIAIVYSITGEYNLALEHYKKALKIRKQHLGSKHQMLTNVYNNLGALYWEKGDYDSALLYNEKAFFIRKNLLGKHPLTGNSLNNIGAALEMMGNFDEALTKYEDALLIFSELFGDRHPFITSTSINIGDIYSKIENHENALFYYQKALIAASVEFADTSAYTNPSVTDTFNQLDLITPLLSKALTFEKMYKIDQNIEHLKTAITLIEHCDSVIDFIRQRQYKDTDKTFLGERVKTVYETAIRICINLQKLSNNNSYLNQAFYFAEKSKSQALSQALSNLTAKYFGGIPKNLLDEEKHLRSKQMHLESEILNEKLKQENSSFESLNNELFNINRKCDSLVRGFEKNYPRYYKLKYAESIISIKELQSRLQFGSSLIEYFLGDTTLYMFIVAKGVFQVESIGIDEAFNDYIKNYRNILQDANLLNYSKQEYTNFTSSSHFLYNQLIEPIVSIVDGNKIIIIPDGILTLAPFETFISKPAEPDQMNYQSLHYLIKEYNISYANSATSLFKNDRTRISFNKDSEIVAFSPSFKNGLNTINQKDTTRSVLSPLKWAEKEVNSLSSHFNSKVYIGKDATEAVFKQEAGAYHIIHIASHSLIDDQNPMYSKIAFALNDKDTLNDHYLHTFELFNTQLNAEMAVLSACNTGYGKVQKGEGVMSLGYAFAYAGVPSIVISHWEVDDQSTYLLMNSFYKNLSEQMNKSEALRQAKLSLLENNSSAYANPYYWAAFVMYGNDEPIVDKSLNMLYILIILIIVTTMLIFYFRKN